MLKKILYMLVCLSSFYVFSNDRLTVKYNVNRVIILNSNNIEETKEFQLDSLNNYNDDVLSMLLSIDNIIPFNFLHFELAIYMSNDFTLKKVNYYKISSIYSVIDDKSEDCIINNMVIKLLDLNMKEATITVTHHNGESCPIALSIVSKLRHNF